MSAFEWDEAKVGLNLRKHGVAFAEAATVFEDPLALSFFDDAHSMAEERWITIGYSASSRMLLVVSTERQEAIRIISARKATLEERKSYEWHNR
ncbi:BrnT family toxin [Allofranklinella schreckenbergeri]|uniref:BrnT family toxin n=1 Tax=Allofranklinella schreckenbergeri TaxID=1076744 RepID=A0A3M6Q883_9BURK|nr:BrnT family toxin [Allofranklinella schreckenbergeri]RMW98618.1 BrnT family toxin [Allofranklinella schreckenbergeri]